MTHLTDCNWIEKPYLDSKENHHPTTPSIFKRTITNILKIKNSILFTIIFVAFAGGCWGQVDGDYRSKIGGSSNWTLASSWEKYNGTGWVDAKAYPGSAFAYDITIQVETSITLNTTGKANSLTINGTLNTMAGKTLTVDVYLTNNGIFAPANGQGNCTVTINGDFTNNGSFINGPNSISVGGKFINNGTFDPGSALTSTFTMRGPDKTISGSSVITFYKLIISGTISTSKDFNINKELTIDGTFTPSSEVVISCATNTTMGGTGTVNVTRSNLTNVSDIASGNFRVQYAMANSSTVLNVDYNGTGAQIISGYSGYKNLILTNSAGGTLQDEAACENLLIAKGTLYITIDDINKRTGTAVSKFQSTISTTGAVAIGNAGTFNNKDLDIYGLVTVRPGGLLNVSGTTYLGGPKCLVLQSDNEPKTADISPLTGSFIHSDLFTGPGSVKVERYMSHDDLWHLYSSPVGYASTDFIDSLSIHNFLKYNPEIPDLVSSSVTAVGMRKYSTASDLWGEYLIYDGNDVDKPAGKMTSGRGFSIRTIYNYDDKGTIIEGTGTIDAIGIPNSNDVSYPLDNGGNQWNCVGNPFTCALDANTFIITNDPANDPLGALTSEELYKYVYLWDAKKQAYVIAEAGIQLGQGFFVKSNTRVGSIIFNSDMQNVNPTLSFKAAAIIWPSIIINVANQTLKSSTKIKFVTNATRGLDPGYDAGMLKANPDFALYSKLLIDNPADICLQSLPDKDYDQYVIPVGLDCKVAGDVTFTAETVNLPSGCQALLEDRLTKRFTRLDLKDAKYTTTVSANTKGTGRFFLHTSDVISGDQPIEKEPFKISKIGKTLYINGEVSDKTNFFVYSVNGKQLANFKAESQVQNEFDASGLPAGVYILTCDDQNQKKSTKFVIEN